MDSAQGTGLRPASRPSLSGEAEPGLTGARNESSVLFSLDQLVKQAREPAQEERIDESALLTPGPTRARAAGSDDLLALGGSGLLMAPPAVSSTGPLTAPEPAQAVLAGSPAVVEPPRRRGRGGLIAAVLLFVIIAGAAGAVLSGRARGWLGALAGVPEPDVSARGPSTPSLEPAQEPSAARSPTLAADAAAIPSGGAEASTAPGSPGSAALPTATEAEPRPRGATGNGKDGPAAPADPAEPNGHAEPNDQAAPNGQAAPTESAPPAPTPSVAIPAEFDRAAATAALGSAAGAAASCKQPDGPTGSGHVAVTFAPSGRATNAIVTGDFAGTAVGGCVARIFRSATVPPFSGGPITVGKSFSIR